MLKRTLVLSLVLASTFATAASLTDKQQANLDEMNAKLQTIEETATSNLESLNKDLASAESAKDKAVLNTKIKMNENNKKQAEKMLEQNKAFADKVANITDEQVADFQKKMDEHQSKSDKIMSDLK